MCLSVCETDRHENYLNNYLNSKENGTNIYITDFFSMSMRIL